MWRGIDIGRERGRVNPGTVYLLSFTLLLSGCTVGFRAQGSRGGVIVRPPVPTVMVSAGPPPPPPPQLMGMAPGPGFVWVDGHWGRRSGNWAWVDSGWRRPPRRGARWTSGRWSPQPSGVYAWRDGRWR
jgi:hypothetical protein